MTTYRDLLQAFLDKPDQTQSALADAIGKSQAAVNRYLNGLRFPDAETAKKIEVATDGHVPFAVWQAEMAVRVGIAA